MKLKNHIIARERRTTRLYEAALEKEDALCSLARQVQVLSRRDVANGSGDKLIAQLTPQQSGDHGTSLVLDLP